MEINFKLAGRNHMERGVFRWPSLKLGLSAYIRLNVSDQNRRLSWPPAEVNGFPPPLLLVLFAIILLTGLITATVGFVKNDVDEYGALNKEFRARQLAESGLAFGIHPQVAK